MRRTGRHVARVRDAWSWKSTVCAMLAALPASWALNAVAPAAVAPTIAMSAPAEAAPQRTTALPAPAVVPPTQVIQTPASLTRASARLSTQDRSRAVLAAARWYAAIGRIESNHGRYGGGSHGVQGPGSG